MILIGLKSFRFPLDRSLFRLESCGHVHIEYTGGAAAAVDLPDVSFLESKQMVSPAAVEVGGDRNVVVLVKHRALSCMRCV